MITRVSEAIKEALDEIQALGYVVMPSSEPYNINILWIKRESPPDITREVAILKADPFTLEVALSSRTVRVPMWLLMGYPWDHPRGYWNTLRKSLRQFQGKLPQAKQAYARACEAFYADKQDPTWKCLAWKEPWSIAA